MTPMIPEYNLTSTTDNQSYPSHHTTTSLYSRYGRARVWYTFVRVLDLILPANR
jgi:hypothetical protein